MQNEKEKEEVKQKPADANANANANASTESVAGKKESIVAPQIKVQTVGDKQKVCIVRPNLNLPSVNMNMNMPDIKMNMNMPSINMPSINMPNMSMNMPDIKMNMPNINMIGYKQNVMKTLFIAIINVLLTPQGKLLMQNSTKVITPAMDLIGKEIIKGIKSNKGKLAEGLKELGKPMVDVLRGLLGTVPVVGNAINVFLAVKDVVNSVIKGTNLISATLDHMLLIPLKTALKPAHLALIHSMDLKHEFKGIGVDFFKFLKLCNDEWAKVQRMELQGIDTTMMLKNNALRSVANAAASASASANANANAAAVIDDTTKKAIQDQDEITWCSGGSDNHRKRLKIIKNSTNRINKTIKRFYSVSTNRMKTQTKSRRHH